MTELNVSVPDSVRQFVDERVKAAGYGDRGAYLRALIEADRQRQGELADLRRQIGAGLKDFETGNYLTYNSPEQFAAEVKARGRKRLASLAAKAKARAR